MHRKFDDQLAAVLTGAVTCLGAYFFWRKPNAMTLIFALLFFSVTAHRIHKLSRTSDAQYVEEERRAQEFDARRPRLVKWSMILGCAALIFDFWNAFLR